ncbi:MAG: hypothetical protein R3E64_10985 [Halioglobus sp.]
MDDYVKVRGNNHIPLFALDNNGHLRAFTDDYHPDAKPGWTMLSLVSPAQNSTEEAIAQAGSELSTNAVTGNG